MPRRGAHSSLVTCHPSLLRSAATNFGRSTMEPAGAGRHGRVGRDHDLGGVLLASREASQSTTRSSQNRKVTSTARSTNVSSSTESTGSRQETLMFQHVSVLVSFIFAIALTHV